MNVMAMLYCLSSAPDLLPSRKLTGEAHGLLPDQVLAKYPRHAGCHCKRQRFIILTSHYLGAGKVTAADVAAAHQKDLAVQDNMA